MISKKHLKDLENLIDEGMPRSMDVEFNRKAGEILAERLRTTTIVIVSHQPEVLEQFVKKAAVLTHGQLKIFDTLEEAKQLYDYETKRLNATDCATLLG